MSIITLSNEVRRTHSIVVLIFCPIEAENNHPWWMLLNSRYWRVLVGHIYGGKRSKPGSGMSRGWVAERTTQRQEA